MKGNIYCQQRCPTCGGTLVYDSRTGVCACESHPEQVGTAKFKVVYGRSIERRFPTIKQAERFLTGIRFKDDEGTLDPRDYQFDQPLAFDKLADAWIAAKAKTVAPGTMKPYKATMNRAKAAWGERNAKTITFGDLEDLFLETGESHAEKTVYNDKTCLETFWKWASKREGVPIPEFPDVKFTLGWREIITLDVQAEILDKLDEIAPFRVALAIRWLATYIAIRPVEMRNLREEDVNVDGLLVVRPATAKERKPKLVPMLEEDIALVRSMPKVLNRKLPFFRHETAWGTAKPGDKMSHNVLWRWWHKACSALNIEGVDLYGGTRHSSATSLGEHFGKDELRQNGTMHGTNKAFERYVRGEAKPQRAITEKLTEMRGKSVRRFESHDGIQTENVVRLPDVCQEPRN